jgi:hypothetical protein
MIAPRVTYRRALFREFRTEDITSASVSELRNHPLEDQHNPKGLRLVSNKNGETFVRTINELRDAQADGYYAATNAEMQTLAHFGLVADLLSAIFIARPSKVSFLEPITRLDLLPAKFVSLNANLINADFDGSSSDTSGTIESWVNDGRCTAKITEENQVFIRASVMSTLTEVMRGDLDGDGSEDVLIWQRSRLVQGTMHWSSSLAFTRKTRDALFSKVELPFR